MTRPTQSGSRARGRRRAAFRLGLTAEALAAMLLRLKGYRILDRRARTPLGEIDLVARRGGTVAIVEVKARDTLEAALEAVGARAQQRLTAAAGSWIAGHPRHGSATVRFDIVAVLPRRLPVHIVNAFEARER